MAAVAEPAPMVEEPPTAAAGEPTAPEQPAGVPEREDLSALPIDESLLIRVKGRVKRPQRPDDTERNAQVQLLQDEIMKYITRQKQIKDILDSKHSNKGGTPEQQALREKLQGLRSEFETVLRGKQRLQADDGDRRTEREKLLSELRTLRDGARGPMSLDALDAKVQELEFKLTHESLSAMDEKKLREQKERLERTERPNAVRASALTARLDVLKAESNELRAQIAEIDKKLDALKAQREAVASQLDALRAKESEARSDIPGLIAERKEASEIITQLRKKQGEIRDAFNEKWQEFKKAERAWRIWAAHERKSRNEERKKEWEERQAARKAADKATRPNKYEMQVFECEQAVAWLRSLIGGAAAGAAAPAKQVEEEPEKGMKLLKKRDDEELGGLFSGLGGKKGKGAKREAARAAAVGGEAKGDKKLKLLMDDLKLLLKLGITKPPTTVGEVPPIIDTLEAKKKDLEAKRDKAAAAEAEGGEEAAPEDDDEAEDEAPKDPVAAAEQDKIADDEDSGPAPGVPAVANGGAAQGVWGSRAAAAAAAVAASAPPAAAAPPAPAPAEPVAAGEEKPEPAAEDGAAAEESAPEAEAAEAAPEAAVPKEPAPAALKEGGAAPSQGAAPTGEAAAGAPPAEAEAAEATAAPPADEAEAAPTAAEAAAPAAGGDGVNMALSVTEAGVVSLRLSA